MSKKDKSGKAAKKSVVKSEDALVSDSKESVAAVEEAVTENSEEVNTENTVEETEAVSESEEPVKEETESSPAMQEDEVIQEKKAEEKPAGKNPNEEFSYEYHAIEEEPLEEVVEVRSAEEVRQEEEKSAMGQIERKIEEYMAQWNSNSIMKLTLMQWGVNPDSVESNLTLYLGKYILKRTSSFSNTFTVQMND